MTIKEIVQRLKTAMDDARGQESHFESWLTQNEGICDAIDALKELDKTEQKPVAWMDIDGNVSDNNDHKCFPLPLYTTPPQRTWVGLTDEEIEHIIVSVPFADEEDYEVVIRAAVAKLKEKNTRNGGCL